MAQDPNFAIMAKVRRLLQEAQLEFQKLPPEAAHVINTIPTNGLPMEMALASACNSSKIVCSCIKENIVKTENTPQSGI